MKQGARAAWLVALTFASSSPRSQQPEPATTPGYVLRLRVVDEDHQPLPGVGVVIGDPATITTDDALERPLAKSDEQGRLAVSVPDDGLQLRFAMVTAPRRASWDFPLTSAEVRSGRGHDCGDVVLPRAADLVGVVRDADGEPLSGATVTSKDLLQRGSFFGSYTARARTDERGTFRLRGVFPTATSLTITASGHLRASVPWVGVGDPVEVRLQRGGVVSGTVEAVTGMPHPTHVVIYSEFGRLHDNEKAPLRDGRFQLELQDPGRYRVTVSDAASDVIAQSRLLEGPATDVAIRVGEPTEGVLQVRAIDAATGEPIRTFRASATFWSGQTDPNQTTGLDRNSTAADDDGCVTLKCMVAKRQHLVHAAADGYASTLLTGATEAATVRLQRAAQLTCRLPADAASADWTVCCAWAEPLPDSPLPADHAAPGQVRAARLTADGAFEFDGLAAGRYVVAVRRRGGTAESRCMVDVVTGQRDASAELALPTPATLQGMITGVPANTRGWRIVSTTVAPQAPARTGVVLDPIAQAFVTEQCSTSLTADGFELTGVGSGEHKLTLIVPVPPRTGPDLRMPLPAVVSGRAEQTLVLDLGDFVPGTIHGKLRIAGADVSPGRIAVVALPGRAARLNWETSSARWSLVAPDGSFSLLVQPGEHYLEVVDVATGITLLSDMQLVNVAPGSSTEATLQVDLATVRVRFDPPPTETLWLQELVVHLGDEDSRLNRPHRFGTLMFSEVGLTYAGRPNDLSILVPPGSLQLTPRQGVDQIAMGAMKWARKNATVQLGVRAGEERTVTLPLPEPQPIGSGD